MSGTGGRGLGGMGRPIIRRMDLEIEIRDINDGAELFAEWADCRRPCLELFTSRVSLRGSTGPGSGEEGGLY